MKRRPILIIISVDEVSFYREGTEKALRIAKFSRMCQNACKESYGSVEAKLLKYRILGAFSVRDFRHRKSAQSFDS